MLCLHVENIQGLVHHGDALGAGVGAPVETTIVTVLPGWVSTPPEGLWSMTVPAGTVVLEACSTTTVKPAEVSAETAWSLV